ncbi:MAG: DUF3015 family protein [Candidatus Omnitrophica bacterium]|nr:DUF3015 family protein [Candidatus Omnitrophota bacterium]
MVKVLKVFALAGITLLVFAQAGMAREFADIYTDCGLGAMIAPRNSAVAAVTNVTWDSGTTAISSNITCPDMCRGGEGRLASFINDSYESIEKELASGSGTYLDTLALLAGYDAQNKGQFIEKLRGDFAKSVSAPKYTDQTHFQKAESLYNLIYKNS